MKILINKICRSQAHCSTCRNFEDGHTWRESLGKVFDLPGGVVDFECPEGFDWGDEPEPKKIDGQPISPGRPQCKYAVRDCCGKPYICSVDGGDCPDRFNDECVKRDK